MSWIKKYNAKLRNTETTVELILVNLNEEKRWDFVQKIDRGIMTNTIN